MAQQTAYQRIKAQAGTINWGELYALLLVTLAIPSIVYIWTNWKIALTVFVAIQVTLGILRLRSSS